MKKNKYILPLAVLMVLWLGLTVFCWAKPQDDISLSERRKLSRFPKLTVQSLINGSFSSDFEDAALDQFPMRDSFRSIKAMSAYFIFGQKDNNGIYIHGGYASKLEYPTNYASISKACKKLRDIYDMWLNGRSESIYLTVIPDKNYFLAATGSFPHIDYDSLAETVRSGTSFAEYIDIFPYLELEDYYRTDSHWRQEELKELALALGNSMGAALSGEYSKVETGVEFRGVYYGQSALPLPGESISYLTNSVIDSCKVYDPVSGEYTDVYDHDKLNSRDPYEMYLSGAKSVITIMNPLNTSEKRLIVFRDSYASSLIPLLAEGYSEITLVDTRYIFPSLLGSYVDFDGADVLFMYSASLLNNSEILK